jgi:hypothetical protein
MSSTSPPLRLGQLGTPLDSQPRNGWTPSVAQDPISPPVTRNGAVSNLERPRKRPRGEDTQLKKPARRRIACQSCRIRKVKCDNAHPTCAICTNTGSECVYIESTPVPVYVDPYPLVYISLTLI